MASGFGATRHCQNLANGSEMISGMGDTGDCAGRGDIIPLLYREGSVCR